MSATALPTQAPASDAASRLVAGVQRGEACARAALYEQHAPAVARVLHAVLGPDQEVADLVQETFIEVFGAIDSLRDAAALDAWIRQVAVNRARSCIRKRQRMRWLHVLGLPGVAEPSAPVACPEAREAVAEIYRILGELSADLRVPFALRYIDGLDLTQVADACDVSLATIKRRLATAESSFRKMARRGGRLDEWLDRSEGRTA